MKKIQLAILLFALFISSKSTIYAQVKAFPEAEGFGKFATGGRGGKVVYVTNLQDAGEGSFRWALEQYPQQPLTILFAVGGVIELKTKVQIKRSNLTIAGQSAPGYGICFTGNSLILNGASSKGNHGNIIIRFIRSRPAGFDSKGLYGFDMENCHDVIIDHCSFSWANEECAALYDTKNTTVQYCLVSEGLYDAGHMKGKRSYGGVWGGQFASYHHNLFAHLNNRAIRFNGSRAHDTMAIVDYRNNVVYNWGNANACYGGEVNIQGGMSQVNIINNYYKPGPATPADLKFVHATFDATKAKGTGQWFVDGNIMEGDKSLTKKNTRGIDLKEENYPSNAIVNQPFNISIPLPNQSAEDAYKEVLTFVGAFLPQRDEVDKRVINDVANKTASGLGVFGKLGIIDHPMVVGGLPIYKNGTKLVDTDGDGIPDEWEQQHGLNAKDANDGNVVNKQGYTMLEQYLNELVSLKK